MIKSQLKLAILLTFVIMLIELGGGLFANSLALISDASHMFMDAVALCLTWFSLIISEKPSTDTKTYGYHRIETFAAFINGLLLLAMACGILYESFQRFYDPQPIKSLAMVAVAVIGLTVNLIIIRFLRKPFQESHDLNIKSAFYHVLGDSFASIGVIIGGLIIHFTGWYSIDPLIGVSIAFLILWGTNKILTESIHILLEGVPKNVSVFEVKKALKEMPAIQDIHELHIWSICSNINALSVHALVTEFGSNDEQLTLDEVRKILKEKFNITHSTIQLESVSCGASNTVCEMKH